MIFRTISVGKVSIGSAHPVAKQTMCTTITRDVDSSVDQVIGLDMSSVFHSLKLASIDFENRKGGGRSSAPYCARSVRGTSLWENP